jgi:hypothetical protein
MRTVGSVCPETWGDNHWTHRMPDRVSRGEVRHSAKLKELDVLTLRAFVAAAEPRKKHARIRFAAERLRISFGHACDIVCRRAWRHVP